MKKITILIIAILFLSISAYSQEGGSPELSFEEMHQDKDYIFLLDESEVVLNDDFTYTTREHQIIKVLKEEGKDWGEISYFYNRARENIISIETFTVTPDGKKHHFTKEQEFPVYEEQAYSDARIKVFTLPEVNIGSVIEIKTVKETKSQVIPESYWEERYFKSNVPIKKWKAKYVFPNSAGIRYKEFNVTRKPAIEEDEKTITYQWDIDDVYDDPDDYEYQALPSMENIENAIQFSSLKSWKEVSDWMIGAVNKNLKLTPKIEKVAVDIFEGKTTLKDKVRAAVEYLRDNFRYVSMSFGDNTFEPHSTEEVFANKYGDCKDISLLLKALLKVGGIEADMVLSNEETEISDPKYDLPTLDIFNHAFLYVYDSQGGGFYVDPLLKGYDVGEFSYNYQGAYTFIINDEGGKLDRFPIFGEKETYNENNLIITINEDGSAITEIDSTWDLDESVWLRLGYKTMDNKEKEEFVQTFVAQYVSGGELLSKEINGLNDRYGDFSLNLKMKRFDDYPVISGLIIIDLSGFERDEDFTKKERKDPIFQRGNTLDEETTIYMFPDEFEVLHLPENVSQDVGFFNFSRELSRDGNKITIKEVTRNKRMTIDADQYQKVKKFFDELPTETSQRIVLKRSSNR